MSSDQIIVQDHERPALNRAGRKSTFPKFGCIAAILLGSFFIGILIAGILIGNQMAKDIESFTDESPEEVPVERGTPEELTNIRGRILGFLDKIHRSPHTPSELQLSTHDLNILVANDTYLGDLRGTIHFKEFIAPNILKTERSRPMSHIKFWKPRRYLNAKMDYRIAAQEGNISLFVQTIHIEGKTIPDYFLQKFKSQDMLEPYKNDERFIEALKVLNIARIEGGVIILTNSSPSTSRSPDAMP
ncbi:MAG: hypothetical protein GY899_17645 [Verrucomicrobiaceae bacterium]|nr:hypothetical protein [Verrucomicrobiaceae bacterium]